MRVLADDASATDEEILQWCLARPGGRGKLDAMDLTLWIQTRATKDNGAWNYSKLQVLVKNTGETIDLLGRPRTDRPDLRVNGR